MRMQTVLTAGYHDNGSKGSRQGVRERRKNARKILKPARALRTEVIIPEEVLRLQQYAGVEDVNEDHIDELSEYLVNILPESFKRSVIEVPTMPARVERHGRNNRTLMIAASPQVLQERSFAKKALANFYQLKIVPKRVWLDEGLTGRAQLAESNGSLQNALLQQLSGTLAAQAGLLPEHTELGGVVVDVHPERQPITVRQYVG